MTTIKKSRQKVITPEFENNFGLALSEVFKSEPAPKRKKKTVTSLIISHRYQIMDLLSKGYSVEQIVEQMAKFNLEISTDIIRSTLRKTDEFGNRISNAKVKKTVKTTTRNSKATPGKPQGTSMDTAIETVVETASEIQIEAKPVVVVSNTSDKPVDAPYRPFVEAQTIGSHEEPKKRRGPVTIDDDL